MNELSRKMISERDPDKKALMIGELDKTNLAMATLASKMQREKQA
jgi:hypothetical protein